MVKIHIVFLLIAVLPACKAPSQDEKLASGLPDNKNISFDEEKMLTQPTAVTPAQEVIMREHLDSGAQGMNYYVYGKEYREEIDKGLVKDSTIAYLWQQRAMPLFKQGKYELGMSYIDKAVKYDPFHWMPYRAFIKCIFAQTYRDAIADFEKCRTVLGNAYVMDHTYNFYIALCKLQLNEFDDAERMLETEVDSQAVLYGDDLVHHLDLFYLGMSKYELGKYEEAVTVFDRALEKYPQFSDVQYYKSYCLLRLGRVEEAEALFALAKENGRAGYTINEDNEVYERYPYQVRWRQVCTPLQSGAPGS